MPNFLNLFDHLSICIIWKICVFIYLVVTTEDNSYVFLIFCESFKQTKLKNQNKINFERFFLVSTAIQMLDFKNVNKAVENFCKF